MMAGMTPPRAPPRRLLPEVSARCTGCGRCVAACGPGVLWLDLHGWKKSAVLHDPPGCTGCSRCEAVCPFDAIHMRVVPRGEVAAAQRLSPGA
jgi:ferredoxin